ncbi:hypothetical protein RQP46_000938 [Phenoliferia psychrophenolica]
MPKHLLFLLLTFALISLGSALRHTGFLRVVGSEPLRTRPGTQYISRTFDSSGALKVGPHKDALKVVIEKAGLDREGGVLYNVRGLNFAAAAVDGSKFTNLIMSGVQDVTAGFKTKVRANGQQLTNGSISQQSAIFQLNLDTLELTTRPVFSNVAQVWPFCYFVAGPGRPDVAHLVLNGSPSCNDHYKGVGSWKVKVEFAPIA